MNVQRHLQPESKLTTRWQEVSPDNGSTSSSDIAAHAEVADAHGARPADDRRPLRLSCLERSLSTMGSTLSRVRSVVRLLLDMKADFEAVEARLKRSPGLPTASPSSTTTHPFWMVPPSAVADHQPVVWPENVDVVIIGSGITGASVARALLDEHGSGLKVLMLEARAACSGATGRYALPLSVVNYRANECRFV